MPQVFINKEQFLEEHNRLSPSHLKATFALLTKFQEEKKPLLKDNAWSIDKHRIPLMAWLLSLPVKEKKEERTKVKKENQVYKNYPETH